MQSPLKKPVSNKKDPYPRRNTPRIKVLPAMMIVPCPGQTAVLTSTGSAFSPADSYSPLLETVYKQAAGYCQGVFMTPGQFHGMHVGYWQGAELN
jgi:hypothetical protein